MEEQREGGFGVGLGERGRPWVRGGPEIRSGPGVKGGPG